MRSLNPHFLLLDLHTSFHSATEIPISTFTYFQTSSSNILSSFPRIPRVHKRIPSSIRSSASIRRPGDRFSSGNGAEALSISTPMLLPSRFDFASELKLFLELVPLRMRKELLGHKEIRDLIEVVLDLGRKPLARFPSGDSLISDQPVKLEDLQHAISKVGDFSDDNRSGIDHSLHRISAIRNRKMQIIGLTCRVGRAVSGSAEMIRDLIEGGGSILVIGPPGVGKTTLIREMARMLADEHLKRVVIVDTSNEIGGDGDVPHSGIGRARRMQVPNVDMQHSVMIEAVENHMPETIIIDEIGTELEALAASTISQRGVQLVGTAHGMTIENIIKNPSLQILVGGIESVTLGDEEARKRKVQKTILERKGPPTFSCAVEMISRSECRVHHRLDATVDAILAGKLPLFEVRRTDAKANKSETSSLEPGKHDLVEFAIPNDEDYNAIKEPTEDAVEYPNRHTKSRTRVHRLDATVDAILAGKSSLFEVRHADAEAHKSAASRLEPEKHQLVESFITNEEDNNAIMEFTEHAAVYPTRHTKSRSSTRPMIRRTSVSVYTYKILEADLLQVAEVMGLEDDIDVTDDIGTADAILASSSELKENPWIRTVAKFHQLPVFVIKSNTMAQMVKAVRMILGMESFGSSPNFPLNHSTIDIEVEDDAPQRKPSLEEIDALEEVRLAIEYIVIPGGEPVELLPRRSDIIARQLELVESYQLAAEKSGTDVNPRLQILPLRLSKKASSVKYSGSTPRRQKEPTLGFNSSSGGGGGGGTSVARLPFLPE